MREILPEKLRGVLEWSRSTGRRIRSSAEGIFPESWRATAQVRE